MYTYLMLTICSMLQDVSFHDTVSKRICRHKKINRKALPGICDLMLSCSYKFIFTFLSKNTVAQFDHSGLCLVAGVMRSHSS